MKMVLPNPSPKQMEEVVFEVSEMSEKEWRRWKQSFFAMRPGWCQLYGDIVERRGGECAAGFIVALLMVNRILLERENGDT